MVLTCPVTAEHSLAEIDFISKALTSGSKPITSKYPPRIPHLQRNKKVLSL